MSFICFGKRVVSNKSPIFTIDTRLYANLMLIDNDDGSNTIELTPRPEFEKLDIFRIKLIFYNEAIELSEIIIRLITLHDKEIEKKANEDLNK